MRDGRAKRKDLVPRRVGGRGAGFAAGLAVEESRCEDSLFRGFEPSTPSPPPPNKWILSFSRLQYVS